MIEKIKPADELFLDSLQSLQERAQRAQAQISSGFRVSSVSDDPAIVSRLLQLEVENSQTARIGQNLGLVKGEVTTAEDSLQAAINILENARAIGAQGSSTANASISRPVLAAQVKTLLGQMVALSQAQSGGRYIFSGDNDRAPAYKLDLSSPTGAVQQFVPAATRLIQHPNGTTFAVAETARQIFDDRNGVGAPTANNAFDALNALRLALENNDEPAIQAATARLAGVDDFMNQHLAWYGDIQNRLDSASQIAKKFQVEATVRIGNLRDADLVAAITELSQNKVHQEAALGAQAHFRPASSLFDFLK
jgi:flagellar hook-associated protein 3 FlgL